MQPDLQRCLRCSCCISSGSTGTGTPTRASRWAPSHQAPPLSTRAGPRFVRIKRMLARAGPRFVRIKRMLARAPLRRSATASRSRLRSPRPFSRSCSRLGAPRGAARRPRRTLRRTTCRLCWCAPPEAGPMFLPRRARCFSRGGPDVSPEASAATRPGACGRGGGRALLRLRPARRRVGGVQRRRGPALPPPRHEAS